MELFEAIDGRYSYRGEYTCEKISRENIERIIKAGIAAPTGMHVQTTSYVAVTDEALIQELAEPLKRYGTRTAPFVLVLVTEDKGTSINFEIENYSASIQNILVAVTGLGYATVWTDGVLRNPEMNQAVRRILDIPAEKTIRAVLSIGVPTTPLQPQTKETVEELTVFK